MYGTPADSRRAMRSRKTRSAWELVDPARGDAVLLVVLLVVLLGAVERLRGEDLGGDRPLVLAALLESLLRRLGRPELLVAVGEDRRAVLGADVRPLAVPRGRVVDLEEDVEEPVVGD